MSVVTEAAWKKQREEAKTLRRENREFRERLQIQAFELENLRAELSRSETIRYSQQERLCVLLAELEAQVEEAIGRVA